MRAVLMFFSISLVLVSGQAFAVEQPRANACRPPPSTLDRLAVPKASAPQLDEVSCTDAQVRPSSTLYNLSPTASAHWRPLKKIGARVTGTPNSIASNTQLTERSYCK